MEVMRACFLILFLALSTGVSAESRYVSDQLMITLRTGQGTNYQILKSLPSGTPLELMREEGDYSLVRTAEGIEGWVRNQYLTIQPIARDLLATAEKKVERLQAAGKQLREQLSDLKADKTRLEQEQQKLSSDYSKLQKELDTLQKVAAKPIQVERENTQLKTQLEELQQQTSQLGSENKQLADSSQRDWFIRGAGVLAGGLLLGLLLPLLRPRRKSGMFD